RSLQKLLLARGGRMFRTRRNGALAGKDPAGGSLMIRPPGPVGPIGGFDARRSATILEPFEEVRTHGATGPRGDASKMSARIMDLTGGSTVSTQVACGETFEFLVSLCAYGLPDDWPTLEVGPGLFENIRTEL